LQQLVQVQKALEKVVITTTTTTTIIIIVILTLVIILILILIITIIIIIITWARLEPTRSSGSSRAFLYDSTSAEPVSRRVRA
jgi:hypothetical protein